MVLADRVALGDRQVESSFGSRELEQALRAEAVAEEEAEAVPAGAPGGQALVFMNADGTFEIQSVVPGSYNLTAFQPAQNQLLSARTRVEVGYGNVENINLILSPGVDITGKVSVDDSKPPQQFQMNRLRVQLAPTEDLPVGNVQAQVMDDGTFILNNVAAMSYRLTVTGSRMAATSAEAATGMPMHSANCCRWRLERIFR